MKAVKALVTVSLFASIGAQQALAAEYSKVTRLGGQPTSICRPAITSADEFQSFALNQRQDVIDILNSSGWSGDPADFFSAVEQGQFVEKSYAVGSKFEWMGQRVDGQPVAKPKKIWAGKQAFSGFELNLESNCQQHTIVVPKACCNISLVASSSLPAMAKPVVIASIDGEIASIEVNGKSTMTELVYPDGSTEALDTTSGNWSGKLAPGTYQVASKSVNDCGESAAATTGFTIAEPVIVPVVAPSLSSGFFFAPFIGRQIRAIDPPLIGIKVGHLQPISENVDFLVQGGASYNLKHEELSLFVDVGLERKFGDNGGFIGGGIGLWDFNTDDYLTNSTEYTREDTTYFIHGGANTRWSYREKPVQWFAEARVFSDFTDDISNHQIIKLGLRYNN